MNVAASQLLTKSGWHPQPHEDIVGILQKMQNPSSIPILKEVILLKPKIKNLDYDDYGSFYKKCFWALRDIGTPEAIGIIEFFTTSEDEVLREAAEYRLSRL